MKEIKKLKVVTHYSKNDPDCGRDYLSIDVHCGGKIVKSFGDYYHDKGEEKLEAWIDAVEFMQGFRPEIVRESRASGKY